MFYLINCSRGQNTEGVCADEVQRAGVFRKVSLKCGEYTFNVTSLATYQLCFICRNYIHQKLVSEILLWLKLMSAFIVASSPRLL